MTEAANRDLEQQERIQDEVIDIIADYEEQQAKRILREGRGNLDVFRGSYRTTLKTIVKSTTFEKALPALNRVDDEFDDEPERFLRRSRIPEFPGCSNVHRLCHEKDSGMGDVFVADEDALRRKVVIKTPKRTLTDPVEARQRFENEAIMLGRFDDQNITRIFRRGEVSGVPYIVLEHCGGGTLRDKLNKAGSFPEREAAELVRDLAETVQYLHVAKVIHRDLKPGNVMFGSKGEIKIGDFGLARDLDGEQLTEPGRMLGTSGYRSPEQCNGEPARRSDDIYSLGKLLHELLTGIRPTDEFPHPSRLDDDLRHICNDLRQVCKKCLAKKPEDRFESAKELSTNLTCYLQGQVVPANPVGFSVTLAKRIKRNKWETAAIVTLLLLLGAVGWIAQQQHRQAKLEEAQRKSTDATLNVFVELLAKHSSNPFVSPDLQAAMWRTVEVQSIDNSIRFFESHARSTVDTATQKVLADGLIIASKRIMDVNEACSVLRDQMAVTKDNLAIQNLAEEVAKRVGRPNAAQSRMVSECMRIVAGQIVSLPEDVEQSRGIEPLTKGAIALLSVMEFDEARAFHEVVNECMNFVAGELEALQNTDWPSAKRNVLLDAKALATVMTHDNLIAPSNSVFPEEIREICLCEFNRRHETSFQSEHECRDFLNQSKR